MLYRKILGTLNSRNDDLAAAFVSFNRTPDVRRALQMDGNFLGGFKVVLVFF